MKGLACQMDALRRLLASDVEVRDRIGDLLDGAHESAEDYQRGAGLEMRGSR